MSQIEQRPFDLLFRIHDEWSVARDWLIERPAGDEQKSETAP